ncbi:hypothetical protein ACMYSQ_010995 [Aspergillus niger]
MIYEGGRGKKDDDDDKTQPSHAEAKLETPIAPGPDFPTLSHAGLSPSSSSCFVIRGFELVSWGVSEADTSSRVLLLNFLFGWSFFQQDRPRSRPGGRSDLRFEAKY